VAPSISCGHWLCAKQSWKGILCRILPDISTVVEDVSIVKAVGWVIWPVKIVPEMTYSVEWDTKPLLTHPSHSLPVLSAVCAKTSSVSWPTCLKTAVDSFVRLSWIVWLVTEACWWSGTSRVLRFNVSSCGFCICFNKFLLSAYFQTGGTAFS